MIGAPLSSTASLFTAQPLRPLTAPAGATLTSWLDGLGGGSPASLKADVAPDQRGLSVQQHAERVLAALLA